MKVKTGWDVKINLFIKYSIKYIIYKYNIYLFIVKTVKVKIGWDVKINLFIKSHYNNSNYHYTHKLFLIFKIFLNNLFYKLK